MPRCPNCGQRTKDDFCQWCGYPLMRGRPIRGEKRPKELTEQKERDKKVNREAEKAKERTKREAEEARIAKQAEEKATKEAEQAAKEKAKQEAQEAKERTKREAEEARIAKQAEEKAKEETEQAAKERAKGETEEAISTELYEGIVKLTIMSPIDLAQVRKLEEYLRQVQDLRLLLTGGSIDEGTQIMVSAAKPLPLIDVLREMPPVEQVVKKGKEIQVTLKVE